MHWKTRELASVCEVFTDGDWIESKDQSDSGVRLIQTGNVGEGVFKDRSEKARFVSSETFTRLRCTEIVPGDCLISRLPDPVGRACIVPDTGESMITAVDCTIVRFQKDTYLPELFAYYSQADSYLRAVEAETTGTTRNRISRARLGQVAVPVPPLPEQRRIVAILDKAFAGIATSKANAEKNLQNAREVKDTYVTTLFSAAQNWAVGPLSSFVESISTGPFGSMLHKSDYVDDGMPLVNPINIVAGSIVPTEEKQVDEATAVRLRSYLLRRGDIVVGRRGEIGRCAVVSDTQDGWLCGTGCFFIRPSSQIEPSFIAHLIRSAPYRARLEALSTGTTMQNLSNSALSGLEVALPGLAEQKRLLAAIDAVNFQTNQLCEIYERKLTALDELKRSLLHQAFSGGLS